MHIVFLILLGLTLTAAAATLLPQTANAVEWTPLITAADFVGIQTDLLTTAGGIISLILIVAAIGILYKIFS